MLLEQSCWESWFLLQPWRYPDIHWKWAGPQTETIVFLPSLWSVAGGYCWWFRNPKVKRPPVGCIPNLGKSHGISTTKLPTLTGGHRISEPSTVWFVSRRAFGMLVRVDEGLELLVVRKLLTNFLTFQTTMHPNSKLLWQWNIQILKIWYILYIHGFSSIVIVMLVFEALKECRLFL